MEERKLNILIVDDDPIDRQMLKRALAGTELDVCIEEVETATAAIENLRGKKYDAALIDYKLPDGTGLSVLKALQETKSNQTPIIMLTVHAQRKLALEALNEGAQDFLPKDLVSADNLERAIQYAIQRNQLFQELQWSKEKERRERELRTFRETTQENWLGSEPALRECQNAFEELVLDYQHALIKAMEEATFRVPQEVPQRMHTIAHKLGDMHAGPKDVVDIHTTALKNLAQKESRQKEEALAAEGRIMLVQLMGYLCSYYRNRINCQSEEKRSKKKQG